MPEADKLSAIKGGNFTGMMAAVGCDADALAALTVVFSFRQRKRVMRKRIVLCGGLMTASLLAHAAPADQALEQCLQHESTTAGMSGCYTTASKAWDKQLNVAYQSAMAKLTGDDKAKLRSAQRAWIIYRDSWLATSKSLAAQQGTSGVLNYGAQVVSLIKNQTLMLQSLTQGSCANPDDC